MRLGLFLDQPRGPDVVGVVRERLAQAAADGFTSAWLPQLFDVDALTLLAAAAPAVPGIEVGTAVVATYPRHPVVLGAQALTVQSAVGGRLTLGIGLSHRIVIEGMFGMSFDRPARHMREYLAALLPIVRGEGKVAFEGETLKANATVAPNGTAPVPVLLAALAPRMLELAGGVADGTVTWMTGPDTIASHIVPSLRAAAEKAGREAPRVVCALPICATDDRDGARQRAGKVFQMYDHLPSYKAMLDREGVGGPADVALVGSEEELRERIGDLAERGVTDYVAVPFTTGEEGERTAALLRSLTR